MILHNDSWSDAVESLMKHSMLHRTVPLIFCSSRFNVWWSRHKYTYLNWCLGAFFIIHFSNMSALGARLCVLHLYTVVVSSFETLYDSSHHVLVISGDIKADVLDQLAFFVDVHKVSSYVSIGLLWRGESHPHTVHLLWDNGDSHVLGRIFGLWGQSWNDTWG